MLNELGLKEVTRPVAGTRLSAVGDQITVLEAGSEFELFTIEGPMDSGPPPHAHPWDEAYFVLDGELEVMLDGASPVHGPGSTFHAPAGTLHTYRIVSPTARFLVVTSGTAAATFFADLDANAPHGAPTQESLPAIIEVAKRNGLTSPLFV